MVPGSQVSCIASQRHFAGLTPCANSESAYRGSNPCLPARTWALSDYRRRVGCTSVSMRQPRRQGSIYASASATGFRRIDHFRGMPTIRQSERTGQVADRLRSPEIESRDIAADESCRICFRQHSDLRFSEWTSEMSTTKPRPSGSFYGLPIILNF